MLNDQSSCLIILVLAAIALWFLHSNKSAPPRGTACSARKAKNNSEDENSDNNTETDGLQVTSARYSLTTSDLDEDSGFTPLSAEGEEQFAYMRTQPKTPNEIRALESMLMEDVNLEPSLGRHRGISITGTLASCNEGTKEPTTKPSENSMFMLPTVFS